MARSGCASLFRRSMKLHSRERTLFERTSGILEGQFSLYEHQPFSRRAPSKESIILRRLRRNPRKKERDGEVEPDLRFSLLRPLRGLPPTPGRNHLLLIYLPTYAPQTRLHNDRISRTLHTCQGGPLFHLHLASGKPL